MLVSVTSPVVLCMYKFGFNLVFCFLSNVRQCNIACSVVHVQHCFKSFYLLLLYFFLAGQGSG